MDSFKPGQRWISNTESELGLGLILEVSANRITMLYLAADERRLYARDNAPLTRVIYAVGDEIESVDEEKIIVERVIEEAGLVIYFGLNALGEHVRLEEVELNHHIQFNKPQDRLFIGSCDPSAWFSLRYKTWQRVQQHDQSPVKGLLGTRTSLIPHQLFIAYESANRTAPRIMLADEVGLGKTIEAGLILHHRLINGLNKRVLIIVPESLLHQWLVEMLRRFNLRFSIFDEARCLGELGDEGWESDSPTNTDNPFLTEQLVLCSQAFFARYPNRQQQALAAQWDMVIVDEAHHLEWSEQAVSSEYAFVEQLSLQTAGLILLTATPEQLGKESHFARLRLLDPDRFYSFSAFLEEERQFEPVAQVAKLLLSAVELSIEEKDLLSTLLKDDNVAALLADVDEPEQGTHARAALIKILLDHHGTGRILFRNSRHTIQGFPERQRHAYPLSNSTHEAVLQEDVRYLWLVEKITQLVNDKALLICQHAETAIALEHTLKNRAGIAAAVFHEGLSIIERDRAAAYFADPESKARVLICSEIGSEGRNFQFVHHLILWDLPENPDLLQQRIGRLDRIGQKHVIQIHIPYLKGTAQELLYRWYDEGMNAFCANCSAAQPVAEQLKDKLAQVLQTLDAQQINSFLATTHTLVAETEVHLHNGRDQLLELNSYRKDLADTLITQLQAYEAQDNLWPYMEEVFECYGVETEFHSPQCYIVRPGDHLRVAHFPHLIEDGVTVTNNRDIALAREDMQFMTWEHPMVMSAMDLILSSETGNAVMSVIKHKQLKAGQFLLECLFVIECSAPAELQVSRFLPPTPIRILIDQHQQNLTASFAHDDLPDAKINFDKSQIVAFLNHQRTKLNNLLKLAETTALDEMHTLIAAAAQQMLKVMTAEIKRLNRLKKVNPTIRAEEIEQLKDFTLLAHEHIEMAQLKLDAVRFIIAS